MDTYFWTMLGNKWWHNSSVSRVLAAGLVIERLRNLSLNPNLVMHHHALEKYTNTFTDKQSIHHGGPA